MQRGVEYYKAGMKRGATQRAICKLALKHSGGQRHLLALRASDSLQSGGAHHEGKRSGRCGNATWRWSRGESCTQVKVS